MAKKRKAKPARRKRKSLLLKPTKKPFSKRTPADYSQAAD